jgi:hypothetical protein
MDLSMDKTELMESMLLNHAKPDLVDHFALHVKSVLSNMTSLMVFASHVTTSHNTLFTTRLEVILLNALTNVMMEELMFTITQNA